MTLMAVFQDVDKCIRCRACEVACQRNWPRHQNALHSGVTEGAQMLVGGGSAETISDDDPTVVKAQRLDERHPYVKYNCWHCPDPPCVKACLATGRAAMLKNADGSVHIEQHKDPTNPWDKQYCDPADPKCRDLAGRLVCVTACQRGGYPRKGLGDGLNDKIYKCTLCGSNAQGNSGRLVGHQSKWIGIDGTNGLSVNADDYGLEPMPACVMTCPGGSLYFGERANVDAYVRIIDNTTVDDAYGNSVAKGTELYPYKAGHSPYPDHPEMAGGWIWAGRDIFGHPTGDPYVEDHAVPMLDMLLNSPAGKFLLIPTLAAGGLYALYERKKARAKEAVQA